jgi:hypothetical protein
MYVCMYVCKRVCIHAESLHLPEAARTWSNAEVCVYVCVRVCMYVYMLSIYICLKQLGPGVMLRYVCM